MKQHLIVFVQLIKYCVKASKLLSIALTFSSAILGFLSTIQLWIIGQIVNSISLADKNFNNFTIYILLLSLCLLIQKLCFAFIPYFRSILITKIKSNLKSNLYSAIDNIPPIIQEESEMQIKIGRAIDFINSNLETSIRSIIVYISSLISVGAVTLLLLRYSVLFPIISIITSIPIVIIRLKQDTDMHKMYKEQYADNQLANYYLGTLTTRDSFLEILLYGAIDLFKSRYIAISKQNMKKRTNYFLKYVSTWSFFESLLIVTGNILSIIIAIYLLSNSVSFSLGTLSIIISGIFSAQNDIIGFAFNSKYIYEATVYGDDYWEILKYSKDKIGIEKNKENVTSIELKDVFFKYPNSETFSLKNINLSINRGETVGLVGENGSGKTTLAKILLEIYEPTNGNVILHKNGFYNHSLSIGAVFQDYNKYEFTPRENIYFGNIENADNTDEIIYAAKKSGAHDFISHLNNQYETPIGTLFPDSTLLSGGEWQRLSVARGFFSEGYLFILDEPNSSLDAKIEAELYEKYKTVISENKCISCFISHRLGATRMCDRIVVLDNGEIIEEGTFEQLMKKKGKYYDMFTAQASLYSTIN